jgi:hypothetical protein
MKEEIDVSGCASLGEKAPLDIQQIALNTASLSMDLLL